MTKISINIPDNEHRFLNDLGMLGGSTVEDMIQEYISGIAEMVIDNLSGTQLFIDKENIKKKYGL